MVAVGVSRNAIPSWRHLCLDVTCFLSWFLGQPAWAGKARLSGRTPRPSNPAPHGGGRALTGYGPAPPRHRTLQAATRLWPTKQRKGNPMTALSSVIGTFFRDGDRLTGIITTPFVQTQMVFFPDMKCPGELIARIGTRPVGRAVPTSGGGYAVTLVPAIAPGTLRAALSLRDGVYVLSSED